MPEEKSIVKTKKQLPEKKDVLPELTPQYLISQGIEKNVSVETIEKLLHMRKELKNEWAKEQFDNAMAEFQAECPIIKKKKAGGKTKTGIVAYKYAPLDDIIAQTKGIISKYGLSYSIKIETSEEKVKAICIVKHKSGHSESSEMEVPLGAKTEIMSMPQVFASASTFAKRYAFCNAFGIMTGDDDNEKNMGKSTQQKLTIAEVLKKISACKKEDMKKWREWLDKTDYKEAQKSVILIKIEQKENE